MTTEVERSSEQLEVAERTEPHDVRIAGQSAVQRQDAIERDAHSAVRVVDRRKRPFEAEHEMFDELERYLGGARTELLEVVNDPPHAREPLLGELAW